MEKIVHYAFIFVYVKFHGQICRNPTLRQVWGWNSHSQKVGTCSPPGLSKTQSSIAGVKTPRIEVFFISLKRSWSVDVENGLACAILTSATQVMVERRAKTVLGLLLGSPETKKSFGCRCYKVMQRILYGGRWWLPPSPGRGESSESMLPVTCLSTKVLQNVN
jgi:hypothetical protein